MCSMDSLHYATVYESYNLCYEAVYERERKQEKTKRLLG